MQVRLGLCAGRHEMPVNAYIFDRIDNPMAFDEMECAASKRIWELMRDAGVLRVQAIVGVPGSMDCVTRYIYNCEVMIYVTGLSSALIAAINALTDIGVRSITLMHYDNSDGSYQPQIVRR